MKTRTRKAKWSVELGGRKYRFVFHPSTNLLTIRQKHARRDVGPALSALDLLDAVRGQRPLPCILGAKLENSA